MKNLFKFILIFQSFFVIDRAYSMEFQHLKLTDKFYKTQNHRKQMELASKSPRNGASNIQKGANNFPTDFEMSPLLKEISGMLNGSHNQIGMVQTRRLLENHDLGGGTRNFSGFTWYKPMLNYNLYANREVAPDLNSDLWIVQDTFSIYVEASTLLTNLKETGLINISNQTIGAFAGLSFKRTYHFYHFADSYHEGISSDYSKLFLSFKRLNVNDLIKLAPHEVIKKTDEYQFNAGGIVAAPVAANTLLQFGFLGKKAFKKVVKIQKVSENETSFEGEDLRISVEQDQMSSFKSHLSLQYDFFKILKITILSSDLEYEYGSSKRNDLSFSSEDLEQVAMSTQFNEKFSSLLKGNSVNFFKNNLVGREERMKENMNSKFSFLLFGSMKKRATEQIIIMKDDIEKTFFKAYSESTKYMESILSRIYSRLIQKIFTFSPVITKKSQEQKKLELEYEKLEHLNANKVETEEQFSLKLSFSWYANKTHKWYQKGLRNKARRNIENYSPLSNDISQKVKNKVLRGPISLNSNIEIGSDALKHFSHISELNLLKAVLNVCKYETDNIEDFLNKRKRRRILRSTRNRKSTCVKRLITRQETFFSHLVNLQEFDLSKFKKFLGYYYSKTEKLENLYDLFGKENLFIHGSLSAKTVSGRNFNTFFKAGQFKGLGVIDNFKNKNIVLSK